MHLRHPFRWVFRKFSAGENMGQNVDKLVEEIKNSQVRGATTIAIRVTEALVSDAEAYMNSDDRDDDLKYHTQEWGFQLIESRPSQITLRNSVKSILRGIEKIDDDNDEKTFEVLKSNADAFVKVAEKASEKIAFLGANIICDGDTVLTNSHSALVVGILNEAVNKMGKDVRVIVTETRPKYQGIKMVNELVNLGIKTTLIVDGAVNHVMPEVDLVIVGADTVSSDGSVISKIGVSQIALSAHEWKVPFYVAAPTFKFSEETLSGVMIALEEGKAEDVIKRSTVGDYGLLENHSDDGLFEIRNPSFDATRAEFVRGVITELYIMSPYSIGEFLARRSGFID